MFELMPPGGCASHALPPSMADNSDSLRRDCLSRSVFVLMTVESRSVENSLKREGEIGINKSSVQAMVILTAIGMDGRGRNIE